MQLAHPLMEEEVELLLMALLQSEPKDGKSLLKHFLQTNRDSFLQASKRSSELAATRDASASAVDSAAEITAGDKCFFLNLVSRILLAHAQLMLACFTALHLCRWLLLCSRFQAHISRSNS